MAISLIRKTQLAPDIADLIAQYGSGYFLPISVSGQLTQFIEGVVSQLSGVTTLDGLQGILNLTGVSGVQVSISGDNQSLIISYTGTPILPNSLYTTGDQNISGSKNFVGRLLISGNPVLTGTDLSAYITTAQTGSFYSSTNPSGFITGVNLSAYALAQNLVLTGSGLSSSIASLSGTLTGNYLLVSQTGNFYPISGNPSGFINSSQTGAFYPRSGNPSGFITSSQTGAFYPRTGNPSGFLLSSQTGAFYPRSGNPSGFILPSQTGAFYPRIGNPSGFITSGQTGVFYTADNPSGFIRSVNLSPYATIGLVTSGFVSKSSTGIFLTSGNSYPSNNPSGFVTTGQVTGFALKSQTGNFITTSQTGIFYTTDNPSNFVTASQTGAFYAASNPNSFVAASQTGAFYAASNPNGFITSNVNGNLYVNGTGTFGGIQITGTRSLTFSGADITIGSGNQYINSGELFLNGHAVYGGQLSGVYYPSNNPSGYITGVNLSAYTLNANTGSFITTAQTGAFYAANNPSGYITGGSISNYNMTGGDLTGNLLSPAIYKIQGNPLSAQAPGNGQTLQWNGSAWVPGAVAAGGNGGGGLVYYFDFGNSSGISPSGGLPVTGLTPVSLLGRAYDVGSGSFTSPNLTPQGQDILVASFVTASGNPGVTNIPPGLWDFNIWANTNSDSATQTAMKVVVNIYNPVTSGYRQIASSDQVYLYDTTTVAQYALNITVPQTGIQSNERIYIQLFASKYAGPSKTITFYFDSYRPSHVHTTLPSVAGNGVVKVINGVMQSPATGIFDSDVDTNAQIQQSKILGLTSSLSALYPNTNPSGYVPSSGASFTTLPTVNGTGVLLSGQAAALPSGILYNTGDQNISGLKTFSNALTLSSNITVSGTGVMNGGNIITGNSSVTSIITLSQAQFNGIVPNANTVYLIVG